MSRITVSSSASPSMVAWRRCEARSPGRGLRFAPALVDGRFPVAPDRRKAGDHGLLALRVATKAPEEVLDPRHHPFGIGPRQSEHRQEHLGGIPQGEGADEVALAERGDLGDQAAADLPRRRFDAVHGTGREPRVEDLAVLDVLGGVDLGRHEPVHGFGLPRRDRLAGEDLRVLVHVAHLRVAGEDPVALGDVVEERRRRFAQLVGALPVAARVGRLRHVEVQHRAASEVAALGHRGAPR
jgi:hypothetical protein